MTAVVTTLTGITFTASEIAACQVSPHVIDPASTVTTLINEIDQAIIKLAALTALVPAGANLTALQAVNTKLTT